MKRILAILFFYFGIPAFAFAHENYVLPAEDIERGMHDWSLNVFSSLKDPHNLFIGICVAGSVLVLFTLYYFFLSSKIGLLFDEKMKRLEPVGHVMLRMALAISCLMSAYFNVFLGPEIPLSSLPGGALLRPLLLVLGLMLLFGIGTRVAAAIGLFFMLLMTIVYRDYMLTYVNYVGEFLALLLFGSMFFSIDRLFGKAKRLVRKIQELELPIIRITYGISVLFPAITIKLLHPTIIVEIAEKFHMTDIHWLFPSDPLLIALGTGLAQILVGLCIIIGFETRLAAFATFGLYVLSVIFFKEAVWPHYILLALALYLVINDGGNWSVDSWIENRKRRQLKPAAK